MPTREEMQSLADEVVRSYADRIAGIAELRATVKTQLKELASAHKAMSTQLRANLAKSEEERLGEARALKQELVRGVTDRKSAVSIQLHELDAAHAAMSKELKADLSKVCPALIEEEKKRQSEAREFKGELIRLVAEEKAAVKARLGEFDSAHDAMTTELKAELAKVRPALAEEERKRRSESREFRGQLAGVIAEGKAAARARLKEFADLQAGVRDEWQKLGTTMRAKRGMPALEVKPPEAVVPPVEEVVAPPAEEVPEEEAMARAEAPEVTPEMAELRDRVFAYLADHPDGTRMTELEEEFGLARIQMARVLRTLMDDNKVEKRDLLYFAI